MAFKFKSSGVIKAKDTLEKEIRSMLEVLDDIEREVRDLDDCWMGKGRDMIDRKFKEFHSQSHDMASSTKKYTEFLDYLLRKYPQTDKEILSGLNYSEKNEA